MPLVFLSPTLCGHGRTAEHCGDCRVESEAGRRYRAIDPPKPVPAPAPVHAETDLYVDHGERRYTYISAGHIISHGLVDLPRIPVQRSVVEKPAARRKSK